MREKFELDILHDTIFRRKSVRKYEQALLDQSTLDNILQRTQSLTSPLPSSPTAFRLLTRNQVKGFAVNAPH